MTKENSKSTLKILALFLTLLALLSTLFTPLLSGFQANASSYTLTDQFSTKRKRKLGFFGREMAQSLEKLQLLRLCY